MLWTFFICPYITRFFNCLLLRMNWVSLHYIFFYTTSALCSNFSSIHFFNSLVNLQVLKAFYIWRNQLFHNWKHEYYVCTLYFLSFLNRNSQQSTSFLYISPLTSFTLLIYFVSIYNLNHKQQSINIRYSTFYWLYACRSLYLFNHFNHHEWGLKSC